MIKIVYMDDVEELILTKHEIDVHLIETKQRKEKIPLDDFFTYVGDEFKQFFFVDDEDRTFVLPYNLKTVGDVHYFFITQENDKITDAFKKRMSDIVNVDYKQCDEVFIAENKLKEYLMIGNHFYTFKI